MTYSTDTIVAPATGTGPAAIAVIRLSGPRSLDLLKTCFISMAKEPTVNTFSHHRMVWGHFRSPGGIEPIDEVMAVFMPGPHSYTGEDVAEIHCHGSPAIVAQIIEAFCRAGARPAQPGEFTRRAFLNGRIDLAQAEAVCDLVRSATTVAGRQALRQLSGELSHRIDAVRRHLVDFAAEVEARLDFPDEEIETADRARLAASLQESRAALDDLIRQGRRGRVFRDGARVAIIGRPNVGKSSLLNALLGRERAIVSPHPGTTRDTIECTLDLAGIPVTLVDTAGWRAAADEVERMGIARTVGEAAQADLLLWVVDVSAPLNKEDRAIAGRIASSLAIAVCNKTDLPKRVRQETIQSLGFDPRHILAVSAVRREGLKDVEEAVVAALTGEVGQVANLPIAFRDRDSGLRTQDSGLLPQVSNLRHMETPLVSNARHLGLLEGAHDGVTNAQEAFSGRVSEDLVMVEVRAALGALDEILGRRFDDDLLDAIFARFCIGK